MIYCFSKYSKLQINFLSFFICCLIFLISFSISKFVSSKFNSNSKINDITISQNIENIVNNEDTSKLNNNSSILNYENLNKYAWALKIPKIDLYAEISEGTDSQTLNKYIGHFEESKKESGNICLAAHNRGYDVNYFSRVKELEIGDEIYYFINENEYKYKIDEILVIYETDWTVIENTEEDRITLITCIENRDAYRLCVRGVRYE